MDNTITETLNESTSTETKVKKLAKVSARTKVTADVDKAAYTIVSAYVLRDYVAAYGSVKATKMLPELLQQFINDAFKSRAKQIQLALAKKKVLAQHRAEWENKIDME